MYYLLKEQALYEVAQKRLIIACPEFGTPARTYHIDSKSEKTAAMEPWLRLLLLLETYLPEKLMILGKLFSEEASGKEQKLAFLAEGSGKGIQTEWVSNENETKLDSRYIRIYRNEKTEGDIHYGIKKAEKRSAQYGIYGLEGLGAGKNVGKAGGSFWVGEREILISGFGNGDKRGQKKGVEEGKWYIVAGDRIIETAL